MDGILFYDVETTGVIDRRMLLEDSGAPRVWQLAALLTDQVGRELSQFSTLIEPDGWTIPTDDEFFEKMARSHGYESVAELQAACERYGESGATALCRLQSMADRASTNVAHNRGFDGRMVRIECLRHNVGYPFADVEPVVYVNPKTKEPVGGKSGKTWMKFCTMLVSRPICEIPYPSGRGGYKWPKLEEAYRHFFDEELVGAHDAMVDVRACKRIYFELRRLEELAKVAEGEGGEAGVRDEG